jgi:hypothetical protein
MQLIKIELLEIDVILTMQEEYLLYYRVYLQQIIILEYEIMFKN